VLARAPLAGGPAKDMLNDVLAADWSGDGRDLAVARVKDSLFRIECPAGRLLTEGPTRLGRVRIAPDGRHVAFAEHPVLNDDRGRVVIMDRSGKRVAATPEWASLEGLAWAPSGSEVLFTASEAGADNSLRGLSLEGGLRVVLASTGRLVLHDTAPDGRVLLERATVRSEIVYRRAGESEDRDLSWLDYSAVAGISPSGDTVLFYESGEGGGPEYSTFLRKSDGSPPVRVGAGRALDLSPDGHFVLSVDIRNASVLDLTPTGPGETRKITIPGFVAHDDAGFLSDSRRIFVTGRDASGRRATWLTDVDGKDPRPLPLPEGRFLRQSTFSSDGSSVVASCPDGEASCRYDATTGASTPIAGTQKGWTPVGTDTRGRLYFRVREVGQVDRLLRLERAGGPATPLADLAPRDRAGAFGVLDVTVASSGDAWAYTLLRRLSDLHVVTGVR
jgi:WD40 repeat protein